MGAFNGARISILAEVTTVCVIVLLVGTGVHNAGFWYVAVAVSLVLCRVIADMGSVPKNRRVSV